MTTQFSLEENAPPPLVPPLQQDVVDRWEEKGVNNDIKVSVLCPTFNHESYIEDAIKGFLSQKTRFRFEVIIRDDCSDDKTSEIVSIYEKKYPSIIKGIYENYNKWPSVKPWVPLRSVAKGKYVALCEGDDYWIDEFKLQKQVDYLESHPDVSFLETHCVWVEDEKVIKAFQAGGTRTVMYRNDTPVPEKYIKFIYFGDGYLRAIMKQRGKLALLDDVTAVWRKHPDGVFGSMSGNNERVLNIHRSQTQAWIAQQFYDEGDHEAANKHMAASARLFLRSMKGSEIAAVLGSLAYSEVRRAGGKLLRALHLKA